MKNVFTTLLATGFTLMSVTGFAQLKGSLDTHEGHRHGEDVNYCANLQYKQKLFGLNPAFEAQYHQDRADLEAFTRDFIASGQANQRGGNYIIPIVFHIIHTNGSENISDDQIFDALEILNEDFNALNPDINNVQSTFQGMQADVGIEFRLAQKKPNQQCFSGITRTYSNTTNTGSGGGWTNDQMEAVQDEHGDFPGDEYLNVFLVANADGAAGYTMTPFSSAWGGASMFNGIILLHNYVGSIGTGSLTRSRALTHEVGHWLNLSHPWGPNNNPGSAQSCNDDDGVDDTPNTIGHQSCALTANTCSNEANFWGGQDPIDNVENFMEYSYCSKMFTLQQGQRMISALNGSTGGRNNLNTSNNLNNTGVNQNPYLCNADFEANTTVVCVGQSVDFTDLSYNAATSWNWTFTGASPASSVDEDPQTITYNTPGTYDVTLQVSDGQNAQTITLQDYITVLPTIGTPGPVIEGFESGTPLPNNDWLQDGPAGYNMWDVTTQAAFTGTHSIKLNNHGNNGGGVVDFISETKDLSNFTSITITFQYAYAKKNSANNERLKIYVSNDCGQSWSMRKQLSGNNFPTGNPQSSAYVPSAAQWEYVEITNVLSSYLVENFRVRFSFESDGGNNIFIDDININGSVGIDGPDEIVESFMLFPNPTVDETNVSFGIDRDAQVSVSVLDLVGKEVKHIITGQHASGEYIYNVNTSDLSSGVYMVRMLVGDRAYTQRLIVR